MSIKKYFLSICCFLTIHCSLAQIQVSDIIQSNTIVTDSKSKIFLIEFWATWCAPCVHVSKHLNIVQEQFPDDLHILSLTEEEAQKVSAFIKKHKTRLTVATDYLGKTFYENRVHSLPYAVLINAKGEQLWKGHPAELKTYQIERFIKKSKVEASINTIVTVHNGKLESNKISYAPKDNFEIVRNGKSAQFVVTKERDYFRIEGSLSEILIYLLGVSSQQIAISDKLNYNYIVYSKENNFTVDELNKLLGRELELKLTKSTMVTEVLELSANQPKLWSEHQFDWKNGIDYEIGNTEIKANNTSVKNMSRILSRAINKPVLAKINDKSIHDWHFH